jgi:hypothetical protein
VAEGGGLLNRYTLLRRIEGSNPSVSAMTDFVRPGQIGNKTYSRLDNLGPSGLSRVCKFLSSRSLSAGHFMVMASCGLMALNSGTKSLQRACSLEVFMPGGRVAPF